MDPVPRELTALLEESRDLHRDTRRPMRETLDELIERRRATPHSEVAEILAFHEAHTRGLAASLSAATVLSSGGGGALVDALASSTLATSTMDVQLLATAASIEHLTVATYGAALALPYIADGGAHLVSQFARATRDQHLEHAKAFNDAARDSGAVANSRPDPAFALVVNKALRGPSGRDAHAGSLAVLTLAIELENMAAETYIKATVLVHETSNKSLFARVMGEEAQHVGVLLALQALLTDDSAESISRDSSSAAQLPAAMGSVGFPHAFYPTNNAAPYTRGPLE